MHLKLLSAFAIATCLAAAPASAQFMAGQRVMDSRCPATFDYKNLCPSVALELGNINLARSADMSSCDKLDNCPKCLTGPEWEEKLKGLGLGVADRTGIRPWVLFRNWLSHEVTSTLAMILLREALGYDAYGKSGTNTGNIDLICCGAEEMMVDFQRWGEGGSLVRLSEEGYFTVQMVPTGYVGTGALYMPGYTLKKYPLADAYNAYKYLPEYASIFPKAFSTNCSDMLLEKTPANIASCGGPGTKYVCSRNTWTNTNCVGGHYVPPQCEGENAQYCQEIYHPDPGTDRGRFEGMVKNNKLNFTIAYVGNDGYGDFLKAKYARGEDFLFMWQLPDPLTSALGGRPINLDPNTAACEAVRNSDPTLNMAGCAYPTTTIQKAARRDVLRQHPDFKFFVDNFQISDDLIAELLVMHKEGSGNMTVHQLTCHWLKNNFNVWSKWIQNTRNDARQQYGGEDSGVAAYVIAVPVVVTVVVVCIIAALVIFFARKTVDNTFAPKTAPLALLFTDVERSTTLWELCGTDMKQAMDTHNTVIRRLIAEYQAYEVKTNGDSFMIACRSLTDATLLAVAIQTALNEATYPPSIARTYADLLGDVPNNPGFRAKATAVAHANTNKGYTLLEDHDSAHEVSSSLKRKSFVDARGEYVAARVNHPDSTKDISNSVCPSSRNIAESLIKDSNCWNGLRVRIALHWATDVTPKIDPMTGRYDYFGHDINVCARVEGYACGGQILVEENTHLHMTRNDDLMELVSPDCTVTLVARKAPLKGVQERVSLWSIVPNALALRRFPIIKTSGDDAGDCDAAAGGYTIEVGTADNSSVAAVEESDTRDGGGASLHTGEASSAGGAANAGAPDSGDVQNAVRFALNFVFNSLEREERTKLVLSVANRHHLPANYNPPRLAKLIQSVAARAFLLQVQRLRTNAQQRQQSYASDHVETSTNTKKNPQEGSNADRVRSGFSVKNN